MRISTFIAKKVTFNGVLRTFSPALSKFGKIEKKIRKWKNCLSDSPQVFLENTPLVVTPSGTFELVPPPNPK
jgi:hypothetical protein